MMTRLFSADSNDSKLKLSESPEDKETLIKWCLYNIGYQMKTSYSLEPSAKRQLALGWYYLCNGRKYDLDTLNALTHSKLYMNVKDDDNYWGGVIGNIYSVAKLIREVAQGANQATSNSITNDTHTKIIDAFSEWDDLENRRVPLLKERVFISHKWHGWAEGDKAEFISLNIKDDLKEFIFNSKSINFHFNPVDWLLKIAYDFKDVSLIDELIEHKWDVIEDEDLKQKADRLKLYEENKKLVEDWCEDKTEVKMKDRELALKMVEYLKENDRVLGSENLNGMIPIDPIEEYNKVLNESETVSTLKLKLEELIENKKLPQDITLEQFFSDILR